MVDLRYHYWYKKARVGCLFNLFDDYFCLLGQIILNADLIISQDQLKYKGCVASNLKLLRMEVSDIVPTLIFDLPLLFQLYSILLTKLIEPFQFQFASDFFFYSSERQFCLEEYL